MKNKISLRGKRAITGYTFILPWLIGVIAFYLRSLILTIQFSFSNINVKEGFVMEFAGWDKYIYALRKHAYFNQYLVGSVQSMLIDVPLIIFFSLFIAIMLNQKFKGRTLIRAIFFLPVIMNAGAISDAMNLARETINGGVSAMSATVEAAPTGVNVQYFIMTFIELGFPVDIIMYISDAVGKIYSMIKASGVQIIVFLAALQAIPSSLYEVSKIEGSTGYETFWKITFPMVTPHILTNVVYTIVDSFVDSRVVKVAYDTAFVSYDYGASSAMSILSTGVVLIILLVVGVVISKYAFYYE